MNEECVDDGDCAGGLYCGPGETVEKGLCQSKMHKLFS